jgi:hypothetical protein
MKPPMVRDPGSGIRGPPVRTTGSRTTGSRTTRSRTTGSRTYRIPDCRHNITPAFANASRVPGERSAADEPTAPASRLRRHDATAGGNF